MSEASIKCGIAPKIYEKTWKQRFLTKRHRSKNFVEHKTKPYTMTRKMHDEILGRGYGTDV